MAVGGAVLLLLGLLLLVNAASDDPRPSAVEPREVSAERRAFTATVPLPATVDVHPGMPGAYLVTARVDPLVLYRLPAQPPGATVKIVGGPPEFACAAVALEIVPAMANNDQSPEPSADSFGVDEESGEVTAPRAPAGRPPQATAEIVVRCLVPPDVRVFPGLRAELVVITAQLPEAIVVPAGAVEPESAESGFVILIDEDDNEVRKPVKLGPSNGSQVVVTEGVAAGDRVLDRVPMQGSQPGAPDGSGAIVR